MVSVSSSAGAASPDEILSALDARKQAFVDGLAEPIRTCVGRDDTRHHLFNGCIDWHSSVHGFWALTAAARVGGRKDLGHYVRRELSEAAIARERAYMAKRPGFEMPYGTSMVPAACDRVRTRLRRHAPARHGQTTWRKA